MLSFLQKQKHDFNIFRQNRPFIRPPGPEPRPKMTANGLSSYQLFAKNLTYPRQKLKCSSVFDIFRKEYVRFYEKVIFWFCQLLGHFWRDLFFGNAVIFWTHAVIFWKSQFHFLKGVDPILTLQVWDFEGSALQRVRILIKMTSLFWFWWFL